jgi:hypothetical protein
VGLLSQQLTQSDSDDGATSGRFDNHVLVTASTSREAIFEVTHSSDFHIKALHGHIAYLPVECAFSGESIAKWTWL